jgi:dihydrofolate reductase
MVSMIAAMAHGRIIGKDNNMPWKLPEDLAYFKKMTLGKTVIMGRRTFESLPGELIDRFNIVISRDMTDKADGALRFNSISLAINYIQEFGMDNGKEIMIIGGGKIYKEAINIADKLYLTHIDLKVDGDTTFPEYESKFILINEDKQTSKSGLDFNFSTYIRKEKP